MINKKCTCGSGRKYKNCCGKKKNRVYKFSLNPDILNTHDGIAIEKSSGKIFGIKDGEIAPFQGGSKVNIHYKRDSGKPKHIQQFNIGANELQIDPNIALKQHDHFFFVDTNKRIIGNNEVFLGTVVHAFVEHVSDETYQFKYRLMAYLEYHNIQGKFENLVWQEVIRAIQESGQYSGNIAIVVDSDFDNLESYNNKDEPVYGDFYLPENFEFLYATAEKNTKNDSILNGLMTECDKAAGRMLDRERISNPEGLKNFTDKPYTAFRQWIE